ncbi:MAG: hypothetical protein WCL04_01675 [Verrucomicrobiota bacterium]
MNLSLPTLPSTIRQVAVGTITAFAALALHAATSGAVTPNDPKLTPGTEAALRRGGPAVGAKEEPARVEVVAVRFAGINASGNSALTWNETDVEINVRSSAAKGDSRFVNRVKITLTLAVESAPGEYSHYRASAEAVTLEVGRANFRFYLPPEVVRRDKLRTEAKLYAVEITADGQTMTPSKFASNAPEARVFIKEADKEAATNNGIMLPQYLTPFVFDPGKTAPSFVRREPATEQK